MLSGSRTSGIAVFLVLSSAGTVSADPCTVETRVGENCVVAITEVNPTQFAVGMREVRLKAAAIGEFSESELKSHLKAKRAPLVIAPDGRFYIIDRHHLAAALLREGRSELYAVVSANWYRNAGIRFWSEMKRRSWVYLYDENGDGPKDPRDLPHSVSRLRDDPYRSLAGAVREQGGYKKLKQPYAEFAWANFFRSRIFLGSSPAAFERALRDALELARSPEARSLPGYLGK